MEDGKERVEHDPRELEAVRRHEGRLMGILNRLTADTGDEEPTPDTDESDDTPLESMLGEEYLIDPVESVYEGGVETKVKEPSDSPDREYDIYAGERTRAVIEEGYDEPESPLWIGYETSARRGCEFGGIPLNDMFQHCVLVGTTGAGKSVAEINMMTQLAYAGHGFIYFDPEAKDSRKLLKKIPDHRLDDVVWIEPGNPKFDRTISLNFLEVPDCDTETELDEAIKGRLQVLQAIFDNEDYWGVNMRTITDSIGRAMMQHNHECDDPSDYYTLLDFYFILLNAQRREEFAQTVDDPFLSFVHEIAEMDDDEVRPMLKRMIEWVQSYVVRKIVACRESSIDFQEILDENKIVIVRTPTTDVNVKQMITLGTMRPIWNAVQNNRHNGMMEPFFAFFDETDRVLNDRLDVDNMLARARSMKLSVTLSCQHLKQLKEKGVWDDIDNLCNNPLYFTVGRDKDARELLKSFRDVEPIDLTDMANRTIWTKIPHTDGGGTDTVKLNTPAPMPDLRDDEGVDEAIRASLDRYGTEPITDAEIQANLKFGDLSKAIDGPVDTEVSQDHIPLDTVLEALFVTSVRESDDDTGSMPVAVDRVQEEFDRRTNVELSQAKFSNRVEEEYGEHIEPSREGMEKIVLTDEGLTQLFSQDTGSAENAGGPAHRYILRESLKTFLALGADASLPSQEGEELPDGVADLPINPLQEATSDAEYQHLKAQCKQEYGRLYELSDGRDIAIEAETTTLKKPKQTLTNLRKAVQHGKMCVFTCKDGSYDPEDFDDPDDAPDHTSLFEYWPRRGERVIYDTDGSGRNITTNHERLTFVSETIDGKHGDSRIFYNLSKELKIEPGVGALRPRTTNSLQWRERATDNGDTEIVLEDKGGQRTVRARFENADAVFSAAGEQYPAYYERTADGYVVHANGTQTIYETKEEIRLNWKPIRPPFIPEREFVDASGKTRLPTADDFMFVVFPDDNNSEFDGPQIYEQGELRPLIPDDTEASDGGSSVDEGQETPDSDERSDDRPSSDTPSTAEPRSQQDETDDHAVF